MIPTGLPFYSYLQEVVQLDEIWLDKMFGATAGDADMSGRFLCLLFSGFNFSLDYLCYHYFGFHLFCSSERIPSTHSRLAASPVRGRDSLVHGSGRAPMHVWGRSGPRTYTCCSHQSVWKNEFNSRCHHIPSILQWMC